MPSELRTLLRELEKARIMSSLARYGLSPRLLCASFAHHMANSRTPRNSRRRTTSWEQRLRDMLLAGGVLAIAGCPGTTDETAFDASAPSDAGSDPGSDVSQFCCNANGDPCCTFEYCGAAMSAACACKLDGGTFNYPSSCVFDGGDLDAGDAGADADTD